MHIIWFHINISKYTINLNMFKNQFRFCTTSLIVFCFPIIDFHFQSAVCSIRGKNWRFFRAIHRKKGLSSGVCVSGVRKHLMKIRCYKFVSYQHTWNYWSNKHWAQGSNDEKNTLEIVRKDKNQRNIEFYWKVSACFFFLFFRRHFFHNSYFSYFFAPSPNNKICKKHWKHVKRQRNTRR